MHRFLLSTLCLAALARSTPLPQVKKSCQRYTLPLNITSLNLKWALEPLETNEGAAAYNTQTGRRDAQSVFHPVTLPTTPETAIYTISGTFCQPTSGGNGTVLLATHGGGYDRSYWHPSIQPESYSFVDYAVAQGYPIFYYDRLGLGQSEMVSGYVAQSSIHASIIKELIKLLRSDKFGSPASKVALIGHSMGSAYSNSVLNSDPGLVDAAILTGIAYNITSKGIADQAKQSRLAKLQNPL
ncbi:hypothetical protein PMZ80_000331 [Knufia obscura]|nr:hypothetical protein PMZ80_000331 [Knufia obscura]